MDKNGHARKNRKDVLIKTNLTYLQCTNSFIEALHVQCINLAMFTNIPFTCDMHVQFSFLF